MVERTTENNASFLDKALVKYSRAYDLRYETPGAFDPSDEEALQRAELEVATEAFMELQTALQTGEATRGVNAFRAVLKTARMLSNGAVSRANSRSYEYASAVGSRFRR